MSAIKDNVVITVNDNSTSATLVVESLEVDVSISVSEGMSVPAYTGAYTFTPTESTQTVQISGKRATSNITINPIPSNYGRITWDGSTLTVS